MRVCVCPRRRQTLEVLDLKPHFSSAKFELLPYLVRKQFLKKDNLPPRAGGGGSGRGGAPLPTGERSSSLSAERSSGEVCHRRTPPALASLPHTTSAISGWPSHGCSSSRCDRHGSATCDRALQDDSLRRHREAAHSPPSRVWRDAALLPDARPSLPSTRPTTSTARGLVGSAQARARGPAVRSRMP